MITINGKNIIGVYIGNKPCPQVYSGTIPLLCNEVVVMQGLKDFELRCWGAEGDMAYEGNGAVITLYGDGNRYDDIYLASNKLEKNKSYKVSFKCSLNSGKHTLVLEIGYDSATYTIDTKEQVIEKTFSQVSGSYFYIGLGYKSPSNNYNPVFTIKDFKVIEV